GPRRRRADERRHRGRRAPRPILAGADRSARRRNRRRAALLSAGWVPHRLVFTSRGAGPFQLAYGSRDAKSTAFPIATLVPGYKGEEDLELGRAETPAPAPRIVIGGAQAVADPQRLSGEAVTRARVDWKRWILWGSLVLGVVVLGWMALRLGRQMSRPV